MLGKCRRRRDENKNIDSFLPQVRGAAEAAKGLENFSCFTFAPYLLSAEAQSILTFYFKTQEEEKEEKEEIEDGTAMQVDCYSPSNSGEKIIRTAFQVCDAAA